MSPNAAAPNAGRLARGRQTTVVITMGTRDHPLDVSLGPVLDCPGLVSVTFRRDKEMLSQAIVTLAAIKSALGRYEAEQARRRFA